MSLFAVARRGKTSIYLELAGGDRVLKAIETIAALTKNSSDDIALFYNDKRLSEDKTFSENGVQHEIDTPVDPLVLFYALKKPGSDAFETPFAEPYVATEARPE